ncbi:MAG: type II toxin-antitoxin system RelE/ParE family toxin [Bifidobacteriaceae bacterium]|jgi:mRNA interferase RelE/StbE|nr:type II toxin-antitoxin system RelE/ParE family toxin [Bifidobacteriaceae bacterium]
MRYAVRYDKRADKQLEKMDPGVRRLILAYIDSRLEGTENPRSLGKGLSDRLLGLWRYRVGGCRVIAEIRGAEITIYIVKIGHRLDVCAA